MTTERAATFSRKSLKWLQGIIGAFLKSPSGTKAKCWVGSLLLLMLCMNAMNVVNSYVLREFMSAIQDRERAAFVNFAWLYAGVFAASTVFSVLLRFSEERLGLLWRDWMTRSLAGVYMDGKIYLRLRSDESLTNPDQRISEDVKSLTVTTLSLVIMLTNSTITVISFSGVLWAISPTLFLVALAYALLGSGLTVLLARPLVNLNYHQADFEADFRADLVKVHQLADGIALAGFEGRSRDRLMERIRRLVENYLRIIAVNRNVGFFTTGYNYLIQLVPIVIVAPMFMNEGVEFGVIGQSAMAFSTLVAALSLIVTQFQSISAYFAVLTRLGEFADTVKRSAEHQDDGCVDCAKSADHFVFDHLTLRSSLENGQVLIENLILTIEKGTRVLINGNHAAQQALFRAAAGVPIIGSGRVIRPPVGKAAFVPENPFLPPGTLRESFVAPEHDATTTDEQVWEVIRAVGLNEAISRHDGDVRHDWHDLLSLRDEQLMAIARAILLRPDFAVLGHLNSSLKQSTERKILKLMQQHGITCISFSDQLPSAEFHDLCLELGDDGSWQIVDPRPERKSVELAG
ncbi:Vitamin B12 transport ATP-binding protein BacA [Caulifigura coniformis]|uniref:Vitamin B12 transport ATP-binding protein BacA n=1 Tax=Caulifigura coniformis TaxID=2527983 RepID=A0A517SDK0_9PLAN|nr:SbmA/BacA-like family transporter [Caulifigura coniformis]QDT54200.1 Vitamin B12 transport ATP-binding protein BacA [Caulifigura coniformis]